jgi:hypothetical protein
MAADWLRPSSVRAASACSTSRSALSVIVLIRQSVCQYVFVFVVHAGAGLIGPMARWTPVTVRGNQRCADCSDEESPSGWRRRARRWPRQRRCAA